MSRRTFNGVPNHEHGPGHMRTTAIPTSAALYRSGGVLNKVLDDIRERDRARAKQEHDISGKRKRCEVAGCEYQHLKGSKYCKGHWRMEYGG